MKIHYSVFLFLLLLPCSVFAQQEKTSVKWKTEPFDYNVFIENRGEFDGMLPGNEKILYAAQLGKIIVFFTPHGVVYSYKEFKHTGPSSEENEEKEKDEEASGVPIMHYLSATWKGAQPMPLIETANKQSYFYIYPQGDKSSLKTNVYKKLIYRNLYPGIDAEYTFPDKKDGGIKYSIIVYPGADVSQVKLEYSGATNIYKDRQGNIVICSELGDFVDHAPESYYSTKLKVASSYSLKGVEESFILPEQYNKNEELIIDPWTSSTSFGGINAAFDLDYDKNGNVYAYGGESITTYLQLVKINSSGIKQWVYNANTMSGAVGNCYGDICTDKNTGTTYILQGFSGGIIQKVNTLGTLVTSYTSKATGINEYWRADFDQCNHQIVIGAGGTSADYQAARIDTNLNTLTPINIFNASEAFHDITLMTLDPYSNCVFMCSAKNSLDTLYANNLVKLPLPSLTPTSFRRINGFGFNECKSVGYTGYESMGSYAVYSTNAMNGAAASPNWVYIYNGDTLKQCSKVNGTINAVKAISATPFKSGGLDVDGCDNIYVGNAKNILEYNSSLTLTSTYTLPDTVYDVHLGPGNTLLACGKDFVTAMVLPTKGVATTITFPSTCSQCNGKASVSSNCGKAPFTYLWSNGSTNQTDTGLCAGFYTVTITDASCPPQIDTAVVNISGKAGYTAVVSDSNPSCINSKGNITVYPSGGVSPYTYSWSNGETTQKDTGLSPGIYTCVITDNMGCRYTVSTKLIPPPPAVLFITPAADSICKGGSVPLSVTGATTYIWSPLAGLSCTNCPNPVATPTANTIYTVVGIDSLGCVGKDSIHIVFSPKPAVSATGFSVGCSGNYLEGFGAATYVWLPDTSLSCNTCQYTYATNANATTYTLVGTEHGCADSVTVSVSGVSIPNVSITASKDTICSGDSTQLMATVTGASNFYWYPATGLSCSTCYNTYAHPSTTTTYEAVGQSSNGCLVYKYITIVVEGVQATQYSYGCSGPVYLSALGSTTTYTWAPATGLSCTNCSNPVATPTAVTTYTVHGTGSGNCPGRDSAVITVVPPAPPTINISTSSDTLCSGDSVLLSATVTGATSFYWYPATGVTCSTCTNTYAHPTATTTYEAYAYNANGCSNYQYITIVVEGIEITKYTYNCSNYTYLDAYGSSSTYTWVPATGLSCTSCQYTVASPTVTTTYTVYGTSSGKCSADDSAVVVVTPPNVPAVSISSISDTICKGDTVKLVATVSGASTFYWYPSTGLTCSTCTTTYADPGITTTYEVYATNTYGCSAAATVTVVVGGMAVVEYPYNCSAYVGLEAYGSLSTYTWVPATGLSCSYCQYTTATPTVTTTYTVYGKGLSQCPGGDSAVVVVTPPFNPVMKITASRDTVCYGDTVYLTGKAQGVTSYYWYYYGNTYINCTNCQNTYAIPTATTTYNVYGYDSLGCYITASVTVVVQKMSVVSYPGGCSSATTLEASGSASNYLWKPATGLSCTSCQVTYATPTVTTTYTVYSSTKSNCPNGDSAVITVYPSTVPVITISASPDTVCPGQSVSLSGTGTGLMTSWDWYSNNGSSISCQTCQNTYSYPSAPSTTYTLYGYNSNGCDGIATLTVYVSSAVSVKESIDKCAGEAILSASGSSSYTWLPATGLSCTSCASTIASPTVATTYTVTGACPGGADTAVITVPVITPTINVTVSTTGDTVCPGDSTRLIATGNNIISYTWSPSTGVSCDKCSATNVLVNGVITYTVHVSDANGCSGADSITVYPGSPKPIKIQRYLCSGSNITLTAPSGESYVWSTNATSSSINVDPIINTSYSVVVDEKGNCVDTVTYLVNVNQLPNIGVCCDASIIEGQIVSLSATGGGTYTWSPGYGLSCTSCPDPTASPSVTTAYFVVVTSDSGCVSHDSLLVNVEQCGGLFVPEAFSPNNDGRNDYLYVRDICISTLDFMVFDRWGNKVFETDNQSIGWDGNYNGKPMNTGSYVYYVRALLFDGTVLEKKGDVTLVR